MSAPMKRVSCHVFQNFYQCLRIGQYSTVQCSFRKYALCPNNRSDVINRAWHTLSSWRIQGTLSPKFTSNSSINNSSTLTQPANDAHGRNCRKYTNSSRKYVLGIETSCDDTGAAVVDDNGQIIGEALESQTRIHVQMGGIIPPVARDLHKKNIVNVVNQAMENANMSYSDLDAIATTVKPGLIMSLMVGVRHTRNIVADSGKPFIPIHHMEAHALTARMLHKIDFPFLVLLASGGHCLLAVVRNVEDFVLIGKGIDDAPGDAYDKIARQLKLKNLPVCANMSGGAAIEHMAKTGDPEAFQLKHVMTRVLDCNFSFAGIKSSIKKLIHEEEVKHGIKGGDILPNVADICATFQYFVLHHLAKRIQRGFLFCDIHDLLPKTNRTLVLSGGVASNSFLRSGLEKMCAAYDCQLICPPPKYCTDNGVMIAWNGMEKLKLGVGYADPETVDVQHRCPLGEDWTERVLAANIKLTQRVKLL